MLLTDLLACFKTSPSPHRFHCRRRRETGWSAALRFAPRRTAIAAKAKARPTAAFVASFAPPAASTEDTAELPKGALSRAPGVASQSTSTAPTSTAEPDSATSSSIAGPSSPARTDKKAGRTLADVDTSDLNLTALALPRSDTDDAWLISQLEKYPVTEQPPFTLSQEDFERDKAYAQRAAAARGETRHHSHYDESEGGDEDDADVNGFFSSGAGKRAAKRKVR